MNIQEQVLQFEEPPGISTEAFGMSEGFNINAAFQEAITDIASDEELALEEKVRRMEVIVSEGTSEVYRDFVDFRQMAAQMEMLCSHDHAFNDAMNGNEIVSGFMDNHRDHGVQDVHETKEADNSKNKKKKKRVWSWSKMKFVTDN